jgi:DNA-binding NtrC family response regulator
MLEANILIVEDETLIALDMADCVEAAGGRVVGPVATVAGALTLLEAIPVDAAILDANLADRDVTPVALLLTARKIPTIIYSGTGLPDELAARHPSIPLMFKPKPVTELVKRLDELITNHMRFNATSSAWTHPPQETNGRRDEITFQTMNVMVGTGYRIGRSASSQGKLIGVLIPVTAEEHGEGGTGGWYLEAGFGPCSSIAGPTPAVFTDLNEAEHWFSAKLAGAAMEVQPPTAETWPSSSLSGPADGLGNRDQP